MADRRSTAIVAEQLHHVDENRNSISETSLFEKFDKDGDGTISKTEFSTIYESVKLAVQQEHKTLEGSKRRTKVFASMSVIMAVFIVILLALNGTLTYFLLEATKEMHSNDGQLVDRNQNALATDSASYPMDIFEMAKSASQAQDDESLLETIQGVEHVIYEDPGQLEQTTVVAKVSAVALKSDFVRVELENNAIILVSTAEDGVSAISTQAVGLATFDGAGNPTITLPNAFRSATDEAQLSQEVKQICLDAGCDLSHCAAPIAPSPLHAKMITCQSVGIWEWPGTGSSMMSQDANGRKLFGRSTRNRVKRKVWGRKRWNRRDGQFSGR